MGTVYAYKSEIDAWWKERSAKLTSKSENDEIAEGPRVVSWPASTLEIPDEGLNTATRSRWLWGLAAVVAASGFLVVFVLANEWGLRDKLKHLLVRGAPEPIRSIAVLPLENLTGDASNDYFADGMTDALITELAKVSALRVISRRSSSRYKDSKKPLPQIARELHVEGIVEGAVAQSAGRVRISAKLIYAKTDLHLWSRKTWRPMLSLVSQKGHHHCSSQGHCKVYNCRSWTTNRSPAFSAKLRNYWKLMAPLSADTAATKRPRN
jgi:TolB-like protein